MKKKNYLLILMLIFMMLCSLLVGCSLPVSVDEGEPRQERSSRSSRSSRDDEEDEDEDEDEEDEDVDEADDDKDTVTTLTYSTPEGETSYEIILLDDQNCTFREINSYPEIGIKNIYEAAGTYTADDNHYTVVYCGYESMVTFLCTVEGNEIVDYDYDSEYGEDTSQIAGVYTCNDPVFGLMKLTVQEDGYAMIEMDGDSGSGSIFQYSGIWDFMFNSDVTGAAYDWYIYFDGDHFTYEEFYYVTAEGYEGEYVMEGELGVIEFSVDGYGNCIMNVPFEGETYEVYGQIYVNDGGSIYSIMASNDDSSFMVDFSLVTTDSDGLDYRYDGTVTKYYKLTAG